MTRPRRYLVRMTVFLVAVAAVAAALSPAVVPAFLANPALNGLIVGVLLVGIGLNLRNVGRLTREVAWIEGFSRDQAAVSSTADDGPRLLAPMATMLRDHQGRGRFTLSAPAMRSLLDGIASRLDEERDLSRYFIGLSIFLGLLGTFWGLLQTVGAISDVIGTLDVAGQRDLAGMFSDLKAGLKGPLDGMGTAFSSSLFGLAGSLVLGFLDLQGGQAQNAFFNDLEDWLSSATRLTSGFAGAGDGDPSVPAYIQALLEQTAESIDELQRAITRGEESRAMALPYQRDLLDRLSTLTDQMRAEQQILLKMAESQVEMRTLISRLTEVSVTEARGALDDATRGHIRNMDVALGRLVDDSARGRDEAVRDIRSEIKLLARTMAALAEDGRRG
jgi:hypothetical protein